MSDTADTKEQEPSIEEILESIRQIISDEDEEGVDGEEVSLDDNKEEVQESDPEMLDTPVDDNPVEEDDVIELTDVVEDDAVEEAVEDSAPETVEDETAPEEKMSEQDEIDALLNELDKEADDFKDEITMVESEDEGQQLLSEEEPSEDVTEDIISQSFDTGEIISGAAASLAAGSLSKLSSNAYVDNDTTPRVAQPGSVTLEDITRELLKPMLKEWLDSNLPPLVEKLVEKEIEKISNKSK